jgi:hypothetical protein
VFLNLLLLLVTPLLFWFFVLFVLFVVADIAVVVVGELVALVYV